MTKRIIGLLCGLVALLAGASTAQAVTHAAVSYNTTSGLNVGDRDDKPNDLRLTLRNSFQAGSVDMIVEDSARDPRTNEPFGTLDPGGTCRQVSGTGDLQVMCTVPSSGSHKVFMSLRGGDDKANWSLSSVNIPPGFFDDSVLDVSGGGGDDTVHFVQRAQATATGSSWNGGDGDDDLRYSGGAPQRMNGDNGDDHVVADAGDDTLNGGADNDTLEAAQGDDSMDGDDGNDHLISHGGSFENGVTETVQGDTGSDTIDLSLENNTLGAPLGGHAEISLDGVRNDFWIVTGPPDAGGVGTVHNYNLTGIENVIGTPSVGLSPPRDGADILTGDDGGNTIDGQTGNDTIRASAPSATAALTSLTLGPLPPSPVISLNLLNPPPRDVLLGSGGDDTITGSGSPDTIDGGIGVDSISGLGGGDSITSKDVTTTGSVFTDTVDCGAGTDAITADLQDAGHLTSCENADISPGREGRHVRWPRRLRARTGGRVPIVLHCPRRASIACNGSLRLTVGKATAGRSSHYRVARGHRKTVVLALAKRFAKRRPLAAVLVASEKGRFGHKTTRLRVVVR